MRFMFRLVWASTIAGIDNSEARPHIPSKKNPRRYPRNHER